MGTGVSQDGLMTSDDVHLVEIYPVWIASSVSHPMQIEHCGLAGLLLNYHYEKSKRWKKCHLSRSHVPCCNFWRVRGVRQRDVDHPVKEDGED